MRQSSTFFAATTANKDGRYRNMEVTLKEKKDIRSQLRDWLAEICPKGKPEDYCQIMANSAKPEVMKVRVFTHDYRYSIYIYEQSDGEATLACTATRRKSLAGLTEHTFANLVDGKFSRVTWELIKAAILRFELVKIAVKAREEQWRKESSHYESHGKRYYDEWLQKGDQIKEHRTYELVGEKEEGVANDPESTNAPKK